MTPGTYLKHRRVAAGLNLQDVAEALATDPRLAEHARAGWIEQIEADAVPMSFTTIVALRCAYRFDLDILVWISAIALDSPVEPPRLCRVCACSDADPCLGHRGSCYWVEQELCSACFTYEPGHRLAMIQSAAAERDVAA